MKFGTAYYPDYFPAADWSIDLDRMKAAGIKVIRILEFGWSWYQPEPDRWEWDGLDRFLDLVLQRRMRVCLSTSTATPPPWFFERHPDAGLMDEQGHVCRLARHMVSWNHPGAWAGDPISCTTPSTSRLSGERHRAGSSCGGLPAAGTKVA